MKWFTKKESFGVSLIFLIVFCITFFNLNISLRRARDVQRMGDLGAISDALEKFYFEYGFFPPSEGGRIKFCKASNFEAITAQVEEKGFFDRELFFQGLRACEWGIDPFNDVINNGESYMKTFPSDPKTSNGTYYYYLSNTKRYQIYSYLEGGESELGFSAGIVSRALPCGNKICSFGKSYADTALDKSIEDYEAELFNKQNK
jgi:hypothetical protein